MQYLCSSSTVPASPSAQLLSLQHQRNTTLKHQQHSTCLGYQQQQHTLGGEAEAAIARCSSQQHSTLQAPPTQHSTLRCSSSTVPSSIAAPEAQRASAAEQNVEEAVTQNLNEAQYLAADAAATAQPVH